MIDYYLAGIPASFKTTTCFNLLVDDEKQVLRLEEFATNLHSRSLEDPEAYDQQAAIAAIKARPGIIAVEGNAVLPEVAKLAKHRLWFNPGVERVKRNYSYRAHGHRPFYDKWYGEMVADRMETFIRLNQSYLEQLGFTRIGTSFEGDWGYEDTLSNTDQDLAYKVEILLQIVDRLVSLLPAADSPRWQNLIDRHKQGLRCAPYTHFFFPKLLAELDAAGVPIKHRPELCDPVEQIKDEARAAEEWGANLPMAEAVEPTEEYLRRIGARV